MALNVLRTCLRIILHRWIPIAGNFIWNSIPFYFDSDIKSETFQKGRGRLSGGDFQPSQPFPHILTARKEMKEAVKVEASGRKETLIWTLSFELPVPLSFFAMSSLTVESFTSSSLLLRDIGTFRT